MRIVDISAGQSLFLSAITGGPSLAYAAIREDWMPVAVGTAVGVVTFLWSVNRSSNDSRFDAILDRLDRAEKEADDYRARWTACGEESAGIKIELAGLQAQVKAAAVGTNEHA